MPPSPALRHALDHDPHLRAMRALFHPAHPDYLAPDDGPQGELSASRSPSSGRPTLPRLAAVPPAAPSAGGEPADDDAALERAAYDAVIRERAALFARAAAASGGGAPPKSPAPAAAVPPAAPARRFEDLSTAERHRLANDDRAAFEALRADWKQRSAAAVPLAARAPRKTPAAPPPVASPASMSTASKPYGEMSQAERHRLANDDPKAFRQLRDDARQHAGG